MTDLIINSINWEFLLRLVVAGVLGTAVGLEREYRAKEAGARTHFLVCVGSALLMIVSQYGFSEILDKYEGTNLMRLDPARIAAQVVSGIGFLGAGIIILQKQMVKGLTTAAGIWAISAVGLAVGAGMYKIAIATTIFILIALELMYSFFKGIGFRTLILEFDVPTKECLDELSKLLSKPEYKVVSYHLEERPTGFKIEAAIKIHSKMDESAFFSKLGKFEGLVIKRFE